MIVVQRDDGLVLAFERVDLPGQWQLPQGGLERGETPVEAAWRELEEETGLSSNDVELVSEHGEWTIYEWPPDVVGRGDRLGQVHRWFFFRPLDGGADPTPDGREFSAWQWAQIPWLVGQVIAFRRPAYERVLV